MAEINYLDFDLLLERSGTGYRARVLRCPAIPTACDFSLPFSDLETRKLPPEDRPHAAQHAAAGEPERGVGQGLRPAAV